MSDIANVDPSPDWRAYCLPGLAMLAVATAAAYFPTSEYPYVYTIGLFIVCLVLAHYRKALNHLRCSRYTVGYGVLTGLTVFALWIPIDLLTPFHFSGSRDAYNPFVSIPDHSALYAFITIRLLGLAIVTPLVEELLWRSFLVRYIACNDGRFWAIDIRKVGWGPIALASCAFGIAHPEWLSASICGMLYCFIYRRTGSLSAPIIAHMVTNLALGIWILHSHQWRYW